jgi:hypothetical protein
MNIPLIYGSVVSLLHRRSHIYSGVSVSRGHTHHASPVAATMHVEGKSNILVVTSITQEFIINV